MSFFGKLKAKSRQMKYVSKKAEEQFNHEKWLKSYSRFITPSRIEVFDTHILINQRTYVRSIVVGLQGPSSEGYPREMTSKTIERLQELSFDGCKIMLSHGLIQIAGDKAKDNLQQASYDVSREQRHNRKDGKGEDLELICKNEDIMNNYKQIYFNSQKSFSSSFIIVITGKEKEVFEAESYIITLLKSDSIEVQIPNGLQLEMFLSALAFPVSESKAWVKVRSDTAAMLCTATNLNSRTDEKGLYFGKDLKTNSEILIDLDTLPAKHLSFLGATGSGKTYSLMLLLMRMHDMLNYRIIYVTPKADKGTDYKAVAKYYGKRACVVDIGDTGANINPLQILIDKQTIGNNPHLYARAYNRHKDLFIKFCKVWMPSLSENADSYLDETLDEVYEKAGIIRDQPETWDKPWPVLQNLYNIWIRDSENSDLGTKQRTAEALKNKTYQITGKGILSHLNRPTTDLDLSKDFIVIDMSNVPELIKDAMNVLVTGMLHSRFNTDNTRDTIIAIDEAGVYLRNPYLSSDMLVTLTQGRSHGVNLWLCTHQPSDFTKNGVREEYQTNMFCNIVLGANIKNAINDVGNYFLLSEDEKNTLLECGNDEGGNEDGAIKGQGLLIVKGQKIPIRFEPTELEDRILKGKYTPQDSPENAPAACGIGEFKFKSEYQWLIDDQKIILTDWIIGDSSSLIKQGYEKHRISRVGESGTRMVYFPLGYVNNKLVDIPHIGKMTVDHYCSVVQLAALGQEYNADEILISHNREVDLQLKYGSLKIGLEVEEARSHTIDQLVKKKEDALEKYDIVKFVCSATDSKTIISAVGEDYVLQKGAAVREFLQMLSENAQMQQNGMNSSEYSVNEAL